MLTEEYEIRKVIINQITKEVTPKSPGLKTSGFVLIIHVQRRFNCGEFTLIHQALRGQGVSAEEVST